MKRVKDVKVEVHGMSKLQHFGSYALIGCQTIRIQISQVTRFDSMLECSHLGPHKSELGTPEM